MRQTITDIGVLAHAPIRTWFGVGGGADRLVKPASIDVLKRCRDLDPDLVVLGEGANLLVCDEGIDRLVVQLDDPVFSGYEHVGDGLVRVGAGMPLHRLIKLCERESLAGIEGLAGFPASIGGAVVMNAGGRFGEIGDSVHAVTLLCKDNVERTLTRDEVRFDYRSTHFGIGREDPFDNAVVTSVDLALTPDDRQAVRQRRLDAMEYKKRTQPLAADSAGCCFKNPTLAHHLDSIGRAGDRVSAGMLIDRAGLKGKAIGSATISPHHANFICADKNGCARDIIDLMHLCQQTVGDTFGVQLQREVVVWERSQ